MRADHLVVGAIERSLCGRAVIAVDVVDQRVVEQIELFQRIHQPANMVIGVLEEPGVDLHLPDEHGLERGRHIVPCRDLFVPLRELTILRNDAQFFLAGEDLFAQLVPALIELAFVLVGPFLGDVVRGVGRARREVHEEGLVGNERLLLPDPVDGLVGHVLHQVVALFGRLLDLDGCGAFIERWIPLVRLAADESVEVFESASAGWPCIKGAGRTGLPDRHFMTFAELSGRISIELEGPREWRAGVGQDASYSRAREVAISVMPPIPTVWWLRPVSRACRVGEQSAVVWKRLNLRPSEARSSAVGVLHGPPKALEEPKPASSIKTMQDVGRTFGRPQRRDRRVLGVGILGVIGDEACARLIRNWKDCSLHVVLIAHRGIPFWLESGKVEVLGAEMARVSIRMGG